MATATMDGEVFRMLRGDGLSEELAAKWAEFFARREGAIQSDITGLSAKIPDREAARAEREAEREVDREVFAAKDDVAVLQNKVETVEDAIISINKRFERVDERFGQMDERFNGIDKTLARLDERISGLQAQHDKFFYIFFSLHIVTITGLVGLLTKGILWGVAP